MKHLYFYFLLIVLISCNENDKKASSISIKKVVVAEDNQEKLDTTFILNSNRHKGKFIHLLKDSIVQEDLQYIPPSKLRLIRNEIFAKCGYKFKSKDLQEYFLSYDWYVPMFDNVDGLLSSLDKYNISVINNSELENKEISDEELFDTYLKMGNNHNKTMNVIYSTGLYYEWCHFGLMRLMNYIFKDSKKYKYMLLSTPTMCDNCESTSFIEQYLPNGIKVRKYSFDLPENSSLKINIGEDTVKVNTIAIRLKPEYKDSVELLTRLEKENKLTALYYNIENINLKIYLIEDDSLIIDKSIVSFTQADFKLHKAELPNSIIREYE